MKPYEAAAYLTTFSLISTLLINSLLIYLTIFHIKLIHGPYKWMIVTFAAIGMIFSLDEASVRPCIHNFNGSYVFFSLNQQLPMGLLTFGTACYGGFISILLTFVSLQFLFRYFTLSGSPWIKTFRGWKVVIWILFVMTPSVFYTCCAYLFVSPDEYGDRYLEAEVLEIYDLKIKKVPRFLIVAYDENGALRLGALGFFTSTNVIVFSSFLIITICAIRMKKAMKTALKQMSERNRNLETQFFKALLVQTAFPTILLVLPTGPVVILPYLELKLSLQSGFLFAFFGLYPPMDGIAMMLIITEYRRCVRSLICRGKVGVGSGGQHQLDNTIEMTSGVGVGERARAVTATS